MTLRVNDLKDYRRAQRHKRKFGNSPTVEFIISKNSEGKSKIQNSKFTKEVERIAEDEFEKDSVAYKNIFNGGEKGYNFFFVIYAQDKILQNGERICLLDDQYRFSEKDRISVIHPQLILYGKDSFSEENEILLNNLVKNLNGYDFPLLITNPILKKDSNSYGFSLDIGPRTKIETDKRFSNGNLEIRLENGLKRSLWTKNRGCAKIYSSINGVVANSSNLVSSYKDDKIILMNSDGSIKKIV